MRPVRRSALILVVGAACHEAALAHGGDGAPAALPGWTWDPWIVLPLLLSLALFLAGWRRLSRHSTLGLSALRRRLALFAAGWITLVMSLVSPLHEAGERSFAAHMLEHELLMLLAAPLLVLSEPLVILLWAAPPNGRRAIGRLTKTRPVAAVWSALTEPITATLIQAAVLWGWHAPMLFDLALSSEGWHAAQHLSFVVSSLLFWTAMIGPRSGRARGTATAGVAALCLFATSVVSGALGALMAFSQSPWYAGYARLGMAPFGLTPAEDQQLAGLIMWIPGGLVHAGAALAIVAVLLKPARTEAIADAA